MIPIRENEPEYARLSATREREINQYGAPIELIPHDDGVSLNINGDAGIGDNPNRTRQHAFHFTADNCIGCHACEAACSEKNDLPPHLAFRSVGYVEGGTFPDFTRLNISMACNHCDDPVCLKGCPTRAYTKHAEYGAVIQDPDICFGCGYCTWVCPYNAPQLDPVAGQVEKCNMCVDRLEVGLKPACVSACVGNALDFGVVEDTPARRDLTDVRIPGFPDPSITQPNIRFEQKRSLPLEVVRTDSAPVKYHVASDGQYAPEVDPKDGAEKRWNLARLSSRENPLVAFTLTTQAAIGAFSIGFIEGTAGVLTSLLTLALVALGMALSTTHLGKPMRFYRGFNNLRHSNLSREGLATVVFGACVFLHMVVHPFTQAFGYLALIGGAATIYFMVRCYLIPARPFWNHPQTATSFAGATLAIGGWIAYFVAPSRIVVAAILLGQLVSAMGLIWHARSMSRAPHEGAVSHYIQKTTFGWTYWTRSILLLLALLTTGSLFLLVDSILIGIAAASVSLIEAIVGRALFYVVVVPTTMPGAFFWRNKAFEQHARDIGLAANPSVGVALRDH